MLFFNKFNFPFRIISTSRVKAPAEETVFVEIIIILLTSLASFGLGGRGVRLDNVWRCYFSNALFNSSIEK